MKEEVVFNIVWMNECLTTPQHEKQIGYWVSSEKGINIVWSDFFFSLSDNIEWQASMEKVLDSLEQVVHLHLC